MPSVAGSLSRLRDYSTSRPRFEWELRGRSMPTYLTVIWSRPSFHMRTTPARINTTTISLNRTEHVGHAPGRLCGSDPIQIIYLLDSQAGVRLIIWHLAKPVWLPKLCLNLESSCAALTLVSTWLPVAAPRCQLQQLSKLIDYVWSMVRKKDPPARHTRPTVPPATQDPHVSNLNFKRLIIICAGIFHSLQVLQKLNMEYGQGED